MSADSVYDKLRMFNGGGAGWAWYGTTPTPTHLGKILAYSPDLDLDLTPQKKRNPDYILTKFNCTIMFLERMNDLSIH